ncbi:MAG: MoxR-like ATPase [uncultured archaeon A07HR60]|nr:MAG: MoxR-like ATPase [uncultured archaeon A07HR60]
MSDEHPRNSPVVSPATLHEQVQAAVGETIVGQTAVVRQLTIALLAGGHVLLEGPAGVAKTTIAGRVATAAGLPTNRVQLTPDVLPADITGTQIYDQQAGNFEFRRGPIFSHVIIADEINRAMPKAQAALLEAMEEGRVSTDGETYTLPSPFFMIATRNPLEMAGTYQLPDSQLDRFMFHITVSTPTGTDALQEILTTAGQRNSADESRREGSSNPGLSPQAVRSARRLIDAVHVSPPIRQYVVEIHRALETDGRVSNTPSPRALIELQRAAKVNAALEQRTYVLPEDVSEVAVDGLCHRIAIDQAQPGDIAAARSVLDETLEVTGAPAAPSTSPADSRPATDGGR